MRTITPALAALLLGSALDAQTYFYSPPHLASTEGRSSSSFFGTTPDTRYQFLTGDLRGQVVVVRGIAFRHDYQSHRQRWGDARTFQNVRILMADGDLATFGQGYNWSFTSNHLSTPTSVFSASVSFPTILGYPSSKPAPWGGPKGSLSFPFRTAWLSTGRKDILADFDMRGGVLANHIPWQVPAIYHLDSWHYDTRDREYYSPAKSSIPETRLNNDSPGVRRRCNDTALGPYILGATLHANAVLYGQDHKTTKYRGKLVLSSWSAATAPNAPVIHAWGVNPNFAGIDVGTGCNRLHVGTILALQTLTVPPLSSANPIAYVQSPVSLVPWSAIYSGLTLSCQAAWSDSSTQRFGLSQAYRVTTPTADFTIGLPIRAVAYDYHATSYGPYLSMRPAENPAMRLQQ